MKILFDHQIFSSFRYSGISRYFCELFQEFGPLGAEWHVSAFFTNNAYLQQLSPRPRFLPGMEFRGKNRILESVNYWSSRIALAKGDFDLFHSTYSKPYDRAMLHGKPYVITVHDMTHEKFTAELPSGPRETAEEKLSIARADAILVPSCATRDDLIRFYPEAASKITVIYHGIRIPRIQKTLFAGYKPYCLYVGTRALYKDFPVALKAFARMPQNLHLLCVGGGGFSETEQQLITELGAAGRVHQHSLDEPGLFSAYAGAEMLLFPSRAEGFGLPVIEAQSQNCIPILSDIACFREIGAGGALYFAPGDVDGCAEQMQRVLTGACARETLQRGIQQSLTRFDWTEAARKTLEVYRSLLA